MKKIRLILNESLISNKDSDIIEDTTVAQKPDYQIIDITVIPDETYYPTIQSILIDLDETNKLKESETSKLDINILSETVNQKTGYSNSLFEFESSNHTITLSLVLQESDRRGIYKVEAYTTRGVKVFESNTYRPRMIIESYLNSLANEYLIDKSLKESDTEQLWCVQDTANKDFSDKGYQTAMYGDLVVFRTKEDAQKFINYLANIKHCDGKGDNSNIYKIVNADGFNKDRMMIFDTFDEYKKSLKESNTNALYDSVAIEVDVPGHSIMYVYYNLPKPMTQEEIFAIQDKLQKNGYEGWELDEEKDIYREWRFNDLKGNTLEYTLQLDETLYNEAEDPIKDDVKEDLAIEPGSDEEATLNDLYEEPDKNEDFHNGWRDYEDDEERADSPKGYDQTSNDYTPEEFVRSLNLTNEIYDLNIDYSNWGDASQEEREKLVRPELGRYLQAHKTEFDRSPKLFDLVQFNLTDANFHTEAKVLRDLYRGGER